MNSQLVNDRDLHTAALTFQPTDRVPFEPGGGRRSTLAAWHRQGLPPPPQVTDTTGYLRELLGIPATSVMPRTSADMDFHMRPRFEEKVIERRPASSKLPGAGSIIVQDWKGNICEISDEFDVTYLRNAIDFVTRSWIRCPVESRADWADMMRRYDANDPARQPADYAQRCDQLARRDYWSPIMVHGPFWQLREWLGFEQLCMMILDDPAFVEEMIAFWDDYISRYLARMFRDYVPDLVMISEDMAYKEKPMIGPDAARRLLVPTWKRWARQCHAAGVKVVEIDSDGHVGMLIPLWIEAGIDSNSPLEVAAGNDLPAYRKKYGKNMAYRGGVDKRAMAKGGSAIEKEIDRLRPVIDGGGFIPSCDHGVPADVSWPDFVNYARLLAKATGWL